MLLIKNIFTDVIIVILVNILVTIGNVLGKNVTSLHMGFCLQSGRYGYN